MNDYQSISDSLDTTVINRSRFITYSYHVKSEDDAVERLKELRKKHSDATHICYAYVSDSLGNCTRFSDDGEPSGTAGKPILDAILKNNLRQSLIAVVRYFGGVKLGSGGLVRAYGGCASQLIDKTTKISFHYCDIYSVTVPLSQGEKLRAYLAANAYVLRVDYTDVLKIEAGTKDKDFCLKIADKTSGKASTSLVKSDYITIS